ncbi:MAG TPA: hypothetical protein DER09_07130 [Prolixibacteraceae bacterium]|nr:hypothetical protein [Prolixibacteraceae bacterium]
MKKYIFLFSIVLLVPVASMAQDLADALRYSNISAAGTARAGAMGNAFGALGGDFTSASINPAGLGLYRSSEFTITPVSMNTSVESKYYGTSREDSDYKFALNNISYVNTISMAGTNEAGIVSMSLGIGYNRIKDFNSYGIIQGFDVNGSYLDYFADRANRGIWSDYYEKLAWKTDVLLYDENNDEYWSDLQDAEYKQSQRKTISKSGSIDEYSIVASFNFNHKLYLGISWGINDLYYSESSRLYENDDNNNIPYFNNMEFNSNLNTWGTGHNFKFGAIYKPINEVRLGVSIHTPTWYRLQDDFSTSMNTSITYADGSETYDESSPYNEYDYRLQTPLRATFSGAFVIGKVGLLSADYELVNYSNAKLRDGGDGYDFYSENTDIGEAYKTSGNLRLGGELVASKNFRLRGGFEYHGSAFESTAFNASQKNADANLLVYSGGIGYYAGKFFADLTYRYSTITEYDALYPTPHLEAYPIPEMASLKSVKNDVLFTLGFRF